MWITLTEFSALARRSLHCCKSVTGSGRRYLMNGSYQRSILDKRAGAARSDVEPPVRGRKTIADLGANTGHYGRTYIFFW
jgi:hypothetical protein